MFQNKVQRSSEMNLKDCFGYMINIPQRLKLEIFPDFFYPDSIFMNLADLHFDRNVYGPNLTGWILQSV